MFNKLFNVLAVVMFSLQMFSAGARFADNAVADGVTDLVLAAFWGGFLLISFLTYASRERRLEKILERSMNDVKDFIRKDHKAYLARKEAENAEQSSKAVKKTSPRSKATAGNRKTAVQKVKKGV